MLRHVNVATKPGGISRAWRVGGTLLVTTPRFLDLHSRPPKMLALHARQSLRGARHCGFSARALSSKSAHWSQTHTTTSALAKLLHENSRPHMQQGLNSAMLRRMIDLISSPSELSTARGAIELFHRKRVEIDEETVSKFVAACARVGHEQSAVRAITAPWSRMILWMDVEACNAVLRSVSGREDASELMLGMYRAMLARGPGANEATYEILITQLLSTGETEIAEKIALLGGDAVPTEARSALAAEIS